MDLTSVFDIIKQGPDAQKMVNGQRMLPSVIFKVLIKILEAQSEDLDGGEVSRDIVDVWRNVFSLLLLGTTHLALQKTA